MTTNNLFNLKEVTYNFIASDLQGVAEAIECDIPTMLRHYRSQWMKERNNDKANVSKFVSDYVMSYPMIPFTYYDIYNFITSLDIETTDNEETYLKIVTMVISDLLDTLDNLE